MDGVGRGNEVINDQIETDKRSDEDSDNARTASPPSSTAFTNGANIQLSQDGKRLRFGR